MYRPGFVRFSLLLILCFLAPKGYALIVSAKPTKITASKKEPPVVVMAIKERLNHVDGLFQETQNKTRPSVAKKPAPEQKRNEPSNDLRKGHDDFLKQITDEHRQLTGSWKEQHAATLASWKKEQRNFARELGEIKQHLFDFPVAKRVPKAQLKKRVERRKISDHIVVPNAFEPNVRHQRFRPTCSAFAGMRAGEIILAQNGITADLSEQYFFWASKPECRKKKCSKAGSWVLKGFQYSKNSGSLDIPIEKDCAYVPQASPNNVTMLPLPSSCTSRGKLRIDQYSEARTLDDMMHAIDRGSPVVAGFKLSENFYKNNGLVTSAAADGISTRNSHAKGHAVLLIGYMRTPPSMHLSEGRVCFIAANSWGAGWGTGGYSCLTEEWVKRFRYPMPFIALKSVEIRS